MSAGADELDCEGVDARRPVRFRTVELRGPARTGIVPRSRHLVTAWLGGLGMPDALVADAALVVTELVTNAVAASPTPDAEVRIRAEFDDIGPVVRVTDEGPGFALQLRDEPPDPSVRQGRGLVIVSAVADVLEVDRVDGRTRVTARMVLPVSGRAAGLAPGTRG